MLKHLPKNLAVRNAFYAASWSEYVMLELIDIPINWGKKMEKKKRKRKKEKERKKNSCKDSVLKLHPFVHVI